MMTDISIIVGLVLICGVLLCIMCWKYRNERILNQNISARASHHDLAPTTDAEHRSLSDHGQHPHRHQLVPNVSDDLSANNRKSSKLSLCMQCTDSLSILSANTITNTASTNQQRTVSVTVSPRSNPRNRCLCRSRRRETNRR